MSVYTLAKNNVRVINEQNTGQTMIFALGFGTDQTAWEQVVAPFLDTHRIVVYDNVGAGKSDPGAFSANKYDTLHSYTNDLLDICDELQIKDAVLVAHSVSGMVATLAGIKAPHHFSKLVLVGASPRYLNDEAYTGGFDQPSLNGLFEAMSNNYFAWVSGFAPAAMGNPNNPKLAENFANTLSAIRPDIAQSVARVIFQSDHRHDLPKLNIPTLLLQSQKDIAVPLEVAEYLNKHIKDSTMKVVDAEGHFPHISAPAEIIREIQNFI
jgi:sigma-B regulation protein RsbQ